MFQPTSGLDIFSKLHCLCKMKKDEKCIVHPDLIASLWQSVNWFAAVWLEEILTVCRELHKMCFLLMKVTLWTFLRAVLPSNRGENLSLCYIEALTKSEHPLIEKHYSENLHTSGVVTHLHMDGGEYGTPGNIEILLMRTKLQKLKMKMWTIFGSKLHPRICLDFCCCCYAKWNLWLLLNNLFELANCDTMVNLAAEK